MYRGGFRTQETPKMEFFMTVANSFSNVAVVLDRPTV